MPTSPERRVHRITAMVVALALSLVACSSPEADNIDGPWQVVKATGSGVSYTPDPDHDTPWIQALPEVEGNTGCNGLRGDGPPPDYDDGHLTQVSWIAQAVGCTGAVAAIEALLLTTLSHDDGIKVTFGDEGDTMRWESPTGVAIDFIRR